ncbi:MAG: ABC transporter ATP-binding protein [Thermoproteota archaeon]
MNPAIEAFDLTKKFKFTPPNPDSGTSSMWLSFLANILKSGKKSEITALENVSFRVDCGEIFCVVGPNGAGKTTLLKILSTILIPDGGTAIVNGFDILKEPNEVKASLTVVPSAWWITLDWSLTVKENLVFWARLFGYSKRQAEERASYVLNLLNLSKYENSHPDTLSSGFRQRVALARGLVVDSPIFLLDEPTINLDPIAAQGFREFIKNILNLKMKRTIVYTTHVLSEAERLGDKIGILKEGKMIICNTLKNLRKNADFDVFEISISGINADTLGELTSHLKKALGKEASIRLLNYDDGVAKFKVAGADREHIEVVINSCLTSPRKISEVKQVEPSLEEVFLFYTGEFQ